MMRLYAGLVAAVLASGAAFAAERETAPIVNARDLDGREVALHGPAVVSFWATWCKPCTKELPHIQRIVNDTPGVSFLAINQDGPRNRAKLRPFWSRLKMTAPIVLDDDGSLAEAFRVVALPTTVLIDADGRIAGVHQGYRPGDEEHLRAQVTALLAPRDTVPR